MDPQTQEAERSTRSPKRRTLLKLMGVAGAGALAGCGGDGGDGGTATPTDGGDGDGGTATSTPMQNEAIGNWPPEGDSLTLGYNADQSGALAPEGQAGRRGFYLAIDHLNNGGGAVDMIDSLSGNGLMGYEVSGVDRDGQAQADPSTTNVTQMIQQDNVQAFFGGISSTVTLACMPIAQQNRVPYSGAISTSGGISGSGCRRYYFHKSIHAGFIGPAAGRLLPDLWGDSQSFYQIYVDYSYGHSNRDSMRENLVAEGWEDLGGTGIAVGELDHSAQIADLEESGADVLLFTSFGSLARAALSQMANRGLLEDIEVFIPHLTGYTIAASGPEAQGVAGLAPWARPFRNNNDYANAFVESFQSEYDEPCTQSAAMGYSGVLQWATMAAENGTMHPPTVMGALEDWDWTSTMGQEAYRQCDHTAERKVFLVEGLAPENRDDTGYSLSLLNSTDPFIYGCDEYPAQNCDMTSMSLS